MNSMRVLLPGLATVLVLSQLGVQGQEKKPYPTMGKIIRSDPRLDKLIPADAKIEKLATGFKWTEGPVWIKDGGYLLFSDIPNNTINKWKEGEGINVFLKDPRLADNDLVSVIFEREDGSRVVVVEGYEPEMLEEVVDLLRLLIAQNP